jgi:hypothetical protein
MRLAIALLLMTSVANATPGDINGDGTVGLEEAIYALQVVAGQSVAPTCDTIDCNDSNLCTIDSCSGGVCSNTPIEGCDENSLDPSFPLTHSVFYAGFENTSEPDVGARMSGGTSYGALTVVSNPAPSSINPTTNVMKSNISIVGFKGRAEYQTGRIPTNEETIIYAWKEYLPNDFYEEKHISWASSSQFKTWRCEYFAGSGYEIFSETICPGGGIFNHIMVENTQEHSFDFRAKPDCEKHLEPFELGVWSAYVLEIYWTTTSTGYYNLYKNGVLVHSQSGVQTLMDGFRIGECDIFWSLGLYSAWSSEGASSIDYYFDDMALFNKADGVTAEQVLAWQGFE